MMTRRQAIKTTALASAALATLPGAIAQTNSTSPAAAPKCRVQGLIPSKAEGITHFLFLRLGIIWQRRLVTPERQALPIVALASVARGWLHPA
jgi:hypothetical protein